MTAPPYEVLVAAEAGLLSAEATAMLAEAGFHAEAAFSGRAALEALERSSVDVLLLDLALTDMAACDVVSRAREIGGCPIIVVSPKSIGDDLSEALDRGAADFVTKPLTVPELVVRLRLAVRSPGRAECGTASFDFETRRITLAGRGHRLTVRQMALLRLLHEAKGAVVSNEALIDGVWGAEGDLAHLRVLIWQLRRKIEPDASDPQFLLVEPGVGYRLVTSRP